MQDNADIPQTESDADFRKRIQPLLKHCEGLRKQYVIIFKALSLLAAIIGLPLTYRLFLHLNATFPHTDQGVDIILGGPLLCITGMCYVMSLPGVFYGRRYKSSVIPMIARLMGLDGYNRSGGINMDDMKSTQILPRFYNRYATTDYF